MSPFSSPPAWFDAIIADLELTPDQSPHLIFATAIPLLERPDRGAAPLCKKAGGGESIGPFEGQTRKHTFVFRWLRHEGQLVPISRGLRCKTGYMRPMICMKNTVSRQTYTNKTGFISDTDDPAHRHVRVWVCVVCVCVYTSPKKTWKQEKGKNMQQKYLRLEACSLKIHRVFLWADLGFRKKGGKKRKEKIQKRLLAKNGKK